MNQKITRIGVFYDGNYFYHVSNYYNYSHERKARLSIQGLHDFIKYKVAEYELGNPSSPLCQIVDAHYFRGRLNARDAAAKGNMLYYDRVFDDILMSAGVTTHYLPILSNHGKLEEKGIDVWLALEALELAFYKKYDFLVLIACDGDFMPLIRKLHALGTRVMLLSWDFEYFDDNNNHRTTRTSQQLLEEVTFPISMHKVIDERTPDNKLIINNLFVTPLQKEEKYIPQVMTTGGNASYGQEQSDKGELEEGDIMSLKEGFGFIRKPPNNVFFHHSELKNVDFNDLTVGDMLKYRVEKDESNQDIAVEIVLTK